MIVNVIVFWMIARFYGPKSFGQLTFAHTLATTFILFADFGFDVLLTNELARSRDKGNELFQRYFSLKLIFTIVSFFAMCLFILITGVNVETLALVLTFSLYMVFTTQSNFLYAFFRGYERFSYETKVSLIANFSFLGFIITMILLEANIILIGICFVLARFIGLVIGVIFSFKVIPKLSYKPVFKGLKEIRSKVFVFGFHFLFSYLFFQLDTILLAILRNDYEVGIYQAVYKLIVLPLVIPEVFTTTLLPSLSKYFVEDNSKWKMVGKLMSKVLFIVIIPIFLLLYNYSSQIIKFIYGTEDYSAAIPILEVFSFTLFIRFVLEPFALMLTTSNRQNIRMLTVIMATILNFVLNYFVIPKYGTNGAAVVSLITNAFVAIIYCSASWSLFKNWIINLKTLYILLVMIVIEIVLKLNNEISVFIASPILLLVFFIVGYFYFTKDERKLVYSKQLGFSLFNK